MLKSSSEISRNSLSEIMSGFFGVVGPAAGAVVTAGGGFPAGGGLTAAAAGAAGLAPATGGMAAPVGGCPKLVAAFWAVLGAGCGKLP